MQRKEEMFNEILEFAFGEGEIYTCVGVFILNVLIITTNILLMQKLHIKDYIVFATQSQMLILHISNIASSVEDIAIFLLLIGIITIKSYVLITISDIVIGVMVLVVLTTLYRKNKQN